MLILSFLFVFCKEYWQNTPPAAAIAATDAEAQFYFRRLVEDVTGGGAP